MNRYIYKLQRKMPWLAIPNLMFYIVAGMATVFVCGMFFPKINATEWLTLIPSLIAKGQVWRLVTFIFIPPQSSLMFMVFALYFYYMIGRTLEDSWGSFGFTVYYLLGMIGTVLASLLTGGADNSFLNLSLFFAYAILYPDETFLLFFILPIKAKWLAIADAAIYVFVFIAGTWVQRGAIIASLLNLAIFFGPDLIRRIKNQRYYSETRRNYRREVNNYDRRYR